MNGYVLGREIEFDLDDIWEYIAADNIDAADRWVGKLFDAFEALGRTPRMGHRREDLTPYDVLFAGRCLPDYLYRRESAS